MLGFNKDAKRTTEQIAADLANLVEEGRALLADSVSKPSRRIERMRDTVDDLSERLSRFQTSATRAARQGVRYARDADEYVHENPWPAIAGGAFLGVMVTLWLVQRR